MGKSYLLAAMEPFAVPGLRRHAERLRASYSGAAPFPHAVIDDLFPAGVIQAIASEVPEQMLPSGCVPGAAACYRKASVHFRKSELHHESMGPSTRRLFATLRSAPFVRFLETLSGVEGLIPDPGYEGSGVHLTGDGGVLAVHHDFNYMLCDVASGVHSGCRRPNPHAAATAQRVQLHRRVNVFVYLNHDWPDAYGGHLELWARNMSRCEARIRPALGRFAVFSSTDFSFHGHPTPLRLPPGRMRRSIAFYYYTTGRPADECEDGDCGTFRNAVWQRLGAGCASCLACAAATAAADEPVAAAARRRLAPPQLAPRRGAAAAAPAAAARRAVPPSPQPPPGGGRFTWDRACVYVLSMPLSAAQRGAVQRQLRAQGLGAATIFPGVVVDGGSVEAVVRQARSDCLVPASYQADANVSAELHGVIGSSVAHLALLSHAYETAPSGCEWVVALADDVAMQPGFGSWVSGAVMGRLGSADFVNLLTVRAWGASAAGPSLVKRVSAAERWHAWASGQPADGVVKSPNLLVSGYVARRASLPVLLRAFQQTNDWRAGCSIDQVLARQLYALASQGVYESYVVDATRSQLSHCAVSAAEQRSWAAQFPARHAACARWHPAIYGNGSRSHSEGPTRLKVEGALRSGRQAGGSPCWHGFVVPHDRVVLDADGGLVTREASTPLSTGGRAWDAARGEAVRAWRACKRISL